MLSSIQLKPLFFSIVLSEGVGLLAGFFSRGSMQMYQQLALPSFAPPAWVFPIVWPILYLLMGIAAYLVFITKEENQKTALSFYLAQLFINFLWPIAFFTLHRTTAAFVLIILLWVLVLITTVLFFRQNNLAGWLMVPYLVWVSFAALLNLFVVLLN